MTIGRFSLITRIPVKTLRYYDEKKLLVPEKKDFFTGYRYYLPSQVDRGGCIRVLSSLGFTVRDIKLILNAYDAGDTGKIREIFGTRVVAVRSEIKALQKIEAILGESDASLDRISMLEKLPDLKHIEQFTVLSTRQSGTYDEAIPQMVTILQDTLSLSENQRDGIISGPFMTMYYDLEYKEEDADIECAFPVAEKVEIKDPRVLIKTIPAGNYLSITHTGPFSGVALAWTRLLSYATEKQYAIAGPIIEINHNDPTQVPEDKIKVELQVKVN
ncbi:MerR family transcriptional regulator [Methanospirillum lacunae]|nr:GyrI-like domain-containing protein [Methanospirillum lacunae]